MNDFTARLKRHLTDSLRVSAFGDSSDTGVTNWALFSARFQPGYISHQRTNVLRSRITGTSMVCAVLAILWCIIDYVAFPLPIFTALLTARILTSLMFAAVAILALGTERPSALIGQFAAMAMVLVWFYFICRPEAGSLHTATGKTVLNMYSLMPYVLFAGLGFFPFTLLESAMLILPLLLVFALSVGGMLGAVPPDLDWGDIGTMVIISGISAITSVSQLRLLIRQITHAAYDVLTEALGRKYGEQSLELTWSLGKRYGRNFSLAFLDLDQFKSVNDEFGHDEGDTVLANAAASIKKNLRASDFFIRWGGEEFLIVLPDTSATGAAEMLKRLMGRGLGIKPDGTEQTASIGIAERIVDSAKDWRDLAQLADKRLYAAKHAGRNRCVGPDLEEYPKAEASGARQHSSVPFVKMP